MRSATAASESFSNRVGNTAAGAVRKLGTAALVVGKVGLAGLAVGFYESVKSAAEFQTVMLTMHAVTHANAATMKEAQAEAIKLGADIHLPATSAKDAAEAMLAMTHNALSMKQAIAAARGAVLLSAAANISNAQSGEMVANALRGFHLPAKDATKVVDDFTGAAKHGGVDMTDLHYALQQSTVGFHALKVPIGDATTAIAQMAIAGIKGGTAGAALNVAMTRLAAPTKKAAAELQALHVHAFNASGQFVGLSNFSAQYTAALSKLTPQQKLAADAIIFGTRGMKAAGVVFDAGAKTFDNLREQVTRAGQAQQLANARTSGFAGALSGLQSTAETIAIEIGLKLLPALTKFARWLAVELPVAVAAAKAALSAVISQVTSMYNWVTQNIGSTRQLAIAIGIAVGVVGTLTIAIGLLNIVMSANPVVLLAVAITALIAGIVLLYERSATTRAIMNELWADIKSKAQAALDWVSKTGIPQAVSALHQIEGAAKSLSAHWQQVWAIFGPVVRAQFQIVKTAVQTALNLIADAIRLFADVIHGRWSKAWNDLKNLVSDALHGVYTIISTALTGLAQTAYRLAVTIGEQIGQGMISGIKSMAGSVASAAASMAKGALDSVTGFLHIKSPSKVFADEVGIPTIEGWIVGMQSMQSKLNDSLHNIAEQLKTATKKELPGLATAFRQWASTAKQEFDHGVEEISKRLATQLSAAKAQITAWKATLTPAEIWLNTQKAREQMAQLTSAVNDSWQAIKDLPAKQLQQLTDFLAQATKALQALQQTAQGAKDTAILAGNTYGKAASAFASDPLATGLVAAQQNFNATKQLFDQGLASQKQFTDAADALDAAKLAASQDSNALALLDDYNAWQQALTDQGTANQAVLDQQAQTDKDRKALEDGFITESTAAWTTYYGARQALGDDFLTKQADSSRKARDAEAKALDTSLKNRFGRIKEHLDAVKTLTDKHYKELEGMATATGHTITDNLANALGDATNPSSSLAVNLKKVAAFIAKYLKTNSPSELGPLSTLDHWWDGFAPALLTGLNTGAIKAALVDATTPSGGGYRSGDSSRALPSTRAGVTNITNIYQQPGETTDGLMQRLNLKLRTG